MILFASDFDDTFHFHKMNIGYIPRQNREAVEKFRKEGNLFGICTGRVLCSLQKDLGPVKVDFNIASTGGLICDGSDHPCILQEEAISPDTCLRLWKQLSDRVELYFHAHDAVLILPGDYTDYPERKKISTEDLQKETITGISVKCHSKEESRSIVEEVKRDYPECDAFQNLVWMDIVAKGVSKGNGLRQAKEIFHADMTAGIGDSANDIPLLDAADISFTFPYADQKVKEHADHIVASVAEAIAMLEKK